MAVLKPKHTIKIWVIFSVWFPFFILFIFNMFIISWLNAECVFNNCAQFTHSKKTNKTITFLLYSFFCFVMPLIYFCLCIPKKHNISPKKYAEGLRWETAHRSAEWFTWLFSHLWRKKKSRTCKLLSVGALFLSIHFHCPSRLQSIKIQKKKKKEKKKLW